MQGLLFSFIKIGGRVVRIFQYFITGLLRCFLVYPTVQAASVIQCALADISGIDGRRNAFFIARRTAIVHLYPVNHPVERNLDDLIHRAAGLLYHTACLLYILLYRSVLSLEDDSGGRKYGECIGIRLSQFDDHVQIMVAADLVSRSRMIHRIPVINIVVAGKISRFVQIDRQRVLGGMIYGAVDGDDCICTGCQREGSAVTAELPDALDDRSEIGENGCSGCFVLRHPYVGGLGVVRIECT